MQQSMERVGAGIKCVPWNQFVPKEVLHQELCAHLYDHVSLGITCRCAEILGSLVVAYRHNFTERYY